MLTRKTSTQETKQKAKTSIVKAVKKKNQKPPMLLEGM